MRKTPIKKEIKFLVQYYSETWLALAQFDKNELPFDGMIIEIQLCAKELADDLKKLKKRANK